MAEKYLFLGSGSEKDPGFEGVLIENIPYKRFMEDRGIIVVDKLIESCHGCYDIMTRYSSQMQELTEGGDRVVAVLQGGLLFGLPSIQATQTTFPIISQPLDMVSYSAFMVPPGHAAIATVGVENKGQDIERSKALQLGERILNLCDDNVDIVDDFSNEKLGKELEKYGLKYKEGNGRGLKLAYNSRAYYATPDGLLVRADSVANVSDWEYLKKTEERHHQEGFSNIPTCQIHRLENLAMFAAKIISLHQPEVREKIKERAKSKRASYTERNLMERE